MSFILDAVKKSEQERRYAQMDTVQSWHYQPPRPKAKKHYWVVIMVLINTLVLSGLVIWLLQPAWLSTALLSFQSDSQPQSQPISDQLVQAPTDVSGENDIALNGSLEPGPTLASISEPQSTPQPVVVEEPLDEVITPSLPSATPVEQGKPLDITKIPALEALPESVMIHIPAIAFSSHLYSSEPSARQVVVNGQKLREGDYLNRDLQLLEIQEKSVVFQQFQYPFKVLLARYWVRSE